MRLREHTTEDAEDFHAISGDLEVSRYTAWEPSKSVAEVAGWLAEITRNARRPERQQYHLAVEEVSTGRYVGGINLEIGDHGQAELEYRILRSDWRRGFASEATRLMTQFGFDVLGLHRLVAACDPENLGSVRVLEQLGMKREGLVRERYNIRGEWRDRVLWGLLASDR